MREVVAEFRNPVMLYSIGKDSSVMLHLAIKAFYPAPLPFPLLHVDTTWKFREMIAFRDDDGEAARPQADRLHQPGGRRARHQPDRLRLVGAHPGDEDRGAEAGARPVRLRRGLRRRPPRRGEEPRQGAHLLVPLARPRLGPAQPAPGTVEPVQHPHPPGRDDPRLPAVELDRARHLGLHACWRTSRSCRSISPRSARW